MSDLSSPFYNSDCRRARRAACRLERAHRKRKGTGNETKAWHSSLKASRRLVRPKGRQYWRWALDSVKLDTKQTWKLLDQLLGNGVKSSHQLSNISAEQYHQFMDDKISAIWDRTSNAACCALCAHWLFLYCVLCPDNS